MKAGKCAVRVVLNRVKTSIVLGVPRLGGNGYEVRCMRKLAKMIATLIVGCCLVGRRGAAPASDKILTEAHNGGVADGIIGLIANCSRNGCGMAKSENQILGFETRANDNRGGEAFVLLIHLGEVAAAMRRKRVFTWRDTCENKSSFGVGMLHATRIERGGRPLPGRDKYSYPPPRHRVAARAAPQPLPSLAQAGDLPKPPLVHR